MHYAGTNDFEYYHPSAATTRDGNLVITITQEDIGGLNFKSGMLQSWNKLCFQYNFYVEVNVRYPGTPDITGFWPGAWAMGNLGRPGYLGANDGLWPYSYDSATLGPCQIRLGRMVQVLSQHLPRDMKVRGVLCPSE